MQNWLFDLMNHSMLSASYSYATNALVVHGVYDDSSYCYILWMEVLFLKLVQGLAPHAYWLNGSYFIKLYNVFFILQSYAVIVTTNNNAYSILWVLWSCEGIYSDH